MMDYHVVVVIYSRAPDTKNVRLHYDQSIPDGTVCASTHREPRSTRDYKLRIMASGPFLLNIKRGNDVETTEIRSLQQVVEAAMQYVNEDSDFDDYWTWLREYLKNSILKRGNVEIGCNDLDVLKDAFESDEEEEGEEEGGEGKEKEKKKDDDADGEEKEEEEEAAEKTSTKVKRVDVPEHAAIVIEIKVKDD